MTTRTRHVAVTAAAVCLAAAFVAAGRSHDGAAAARAESYLTPIPPLVPLSQKECDDLDAAWTRIRQSVAADHAACLDSVKGQPCLLDPETGCDCITCGRFHNSASLGVADVDACRTSVRQYEREKEAADRLAREREEEVKRRQAWERQQADDAARKRKDEITRERTLEDRRRKDAQAREERDRKAWQDITKISADLQRAYDELRQVRQHERDQLAAEQAATASRFEQTLSQAQDAARRWQDKFEVTLKAGDRVITGTTPQSNVGDFALDSDPKDATAGRAVDGLTTIAKSVVPFASIPFAILANSYHASVAAINELGYALEHFDEADPNFVGGIADRFKERVFGPKAMMKVFVDEVAQPIAEEAVVKPFFHDRLTTLAHDASERATRAWESGDIRELVREGTPPESRLPLVRYWWTQATPAEPTWHTDSRGVVLLADSDNRVFGMDSGTGRVSYSPENVERLIADRGLHLVRRGPDPPWVDHVAVVVAPTSETDDAADWMTDFAAWRMAAEAIGAAYDVGYEPVKKWFDSIRKKSK